MTWWWVGNALGLFVVIPLVLVLAARVLTPALEIRRYARDIAEHSSGIAGNLDGLVELDRTRGAAAAVKGKAVLYATALDRIL